MLAKMDAIRTSTDEIVANLETILERNNKPGIALVDHWGVNQAQAVLLMKELTSFADHLARTADTLTEEDTSALLESQERFRASQERQGDVIRRVKKAVGMIP